MTQRITIGSQEYEIDAHQVLETALGFYVGLRKVEKPMSHEADAERYLCRCMQCHKAQPKESERLFAEYVKKYEVFDGGETAKAFADYIIQRVREEVVK
jgi:hypothetical protein